MSRQAFRARQIGLTLALLGLTFLPVTAQEQTPEITASWSPPTTGSPVVMYMLQVFADGELDMVVQTPDTSYTWNPGVFEWHVTYVARVAGVDALDRQGPWSEDSDELVLDPGEPGQPGGCQWTVGR